MIFSYAQFSYLVSFGKGRFNQFDYTFDLFSFILVKFLLVHFFYLEGFWLHFISISFRTVFLYPVWSKLPTVVRIYWPQVWLYTPLYTVQCSVSIVYSL